MNDKTYQSLTGAPVPAVQQFQAKDGTWNGFIDERHFQNTVEDGGWPLRTLYTQEAIDALRAQLAEPIDMVLHCPACGMQHIDEPDWQNDPQLGAIRERRLNVASQRDQVSCEAPLRAPIHRSHLCRPEDGGCGHIWRPADVPTNGVEAVKTCGKADSKLAAPTDTLRAQLAEAQRDAERLDWIEKIALRVQPSPPRRGMWKFGDELIVGMSLRAAIDAARDEPL